MTQPDDHVPQQDTTAPASGDAPGDGVNPYDPPAPEHVAEPITAEAVADQTTTPRRRPQPHIGWAVLLTIGLFLFQILFSIAGGLFVLVILLSIGGSRPDSLQDPEFLDQLAVWMVPVATLANLVFALIVAGIAFRRRLFQLLGFGGMAAHQWVLVLLLVLPLAIVASEIGNWASEVLPTIDIEIPPQFAAGPWLLVFIGGCLLPGLGEEIFFRGYLSRGLIARHGLFFGVFFASLLFALVHINPPQVVGTFVLGLGMQHVFLTTRSLLAPIVLHTLNNAGAFLAMRMQDRFPIPGLNVAVEEGIVHTPAPLFLAAIAATALVGYSFYQTRTLWKLDENRLWTPGYVSGERPAAELGARRTFPAPSFVAIALMLAAFGLTAHFLYRAHVNFGA